MFIKIKHESQDFGHGTKKYIVFYIGKENNDFDYEIYEMFEFNEKGLFDSVIAIKELKVEGYTIIFE